MPMSETEPCYEGASARTQAEAFLTIVAALDSVVLRDCETSSAVEGKIDRAMIKQILQHVCAHFGFDGSVIQTHRETWQGRLSESVRQNPMLLEIATGLAVQAFNARAAAQYPPSSTQIDPNAVAPAAPVEP